MLANDIVEGAPQPRVHHPNLADGINYRLQPSAMRRKHQPRAGDLLGIGVLDQLVEHAEGFTNRRDRGLQ